MTRIVSTYELRTNLGEIMNLVYYQGEDILVTKTNKPMVRIIKAHIKKSKQKDFKTIWNDFRTLAKEGKQIDLVAFLRKDRDSGHKIHY